jgi:hypothetical protein
MEQAPSRSSPGFGLRPASSGPALRGSMTSSRHHLKKKPTARQLDLISRLCQERRFIFDRPPSTFRQADEQIKALLAMPRLRGDRIEDREAVDEGFDEWGGASAVRDDEIEGYGSTARWAGRTLDEACA